MTGRALCPDSFYPGGTAHCIDWLRGEGGPQTRSRRQNPLGPAGNQTSIGGINMTEQASLEVTLSACIMEVQSSILGRDTGYPDKVFHGFPQKKSSISSRSLPLSTFPINH